MIPGYLASRNIEDSPLICTFPFQAQTTTTLLHFSFLRPGPPFGSVSISFCFLLFLLTSGINTFGQNSLPDTRVFRTYHQPEQLSLKYQYYFDYWSEQQVYHGEWEQWRKNGRPIELRQYTHGNLDGKLIQYRRNGQMRQASTYHDGLLDGPTIRYDRKGRIKQVIPFQAGKRSGLRKFYDSSGTLRKVITYLEGKPSGVRQIFNKDGILTRERQL